MVANYTIQGDSFTAGLPRVWSPTPVRRTTVQFANFEKDVKIDQKLFVIKTNTVPGGD